MPRIARQKTYDAIFHIMCKSISEVDLFKDDEDKLKYLSIIKKYQGIYMFRVYGYCLMSNHAHIMIDVNGSDISKIMHSINFAYAQYFNRRHKRHGHLFQDRFKSKIVKDERYLLTLSAYIHNNPTDMEGYGECPEKYEFSSLAIYLGLRYDPYELVDDGFIIGLFGKNTKSARERYLKFVFKCNDKNFGEEIEFTSEGSEYRSYRRILVRNMEPDTISEYVSIKMNVERVKLHAKNARDIVEAKALLVILMRSFCNFKCGDICNVLGNITSVRVSKLSSLGLKLIDEDKKFRDYVKDFINTFAA